MELLLLNAEDSADARIQLTADVATFGRQADNDIALDDGEMSRYHARLERRGDGWAVLDLNSTNGVYVNGTRIQGESQLMEGDELRIGTAIFAAVADGTGDETRTIISVAGLSDDSVLATVDHFDVQRHLASSSLGMVFQGRDRRTGGNVRILALPGDVDAAASQRLAENVPRVRTLNDSGIVPVKELHRVAVVDDRAPEPIGIQAGQLLAVSAWVEATPLPEWRRHYRYGKAPVGEALGLCGRLAKVLLRCHAKGMAHGALEPAAVAVTTMTGEVILYDVGIRAALRGSGDQGGQVDAPSVPKRYLAPELWHGKPPTPDADQYSLGAIFYEFVAGRVPFEDVFESGDAVKAFNTVQMEAPRPLEELTPKQNKALARALGKHTGGRFANCADMLAALEGKGGGSTLPVPLLAGGGVVVAVVLIVILVVLLRGCG